MNLAEFLAPSDSDRGARTLETLSRRKTVHLVLTGGLATEAHLLKRGARVQPRGLNDIDLLAGSFDDIPKTLAAHFLFRHVHPHDLPGRTLLQAVNRETSVRVDIFRAYGNEMARAAGVEVAGCAIRMISLEDLIARNARLCLDLASSTSVPVKHCRDFLRLWPLANISAIEQIWPEHRKPGHPHTFAEAADRLADLISERSDLQIEIDYTQDVNQVCSRCQSTEFFPLADPRRILALLGYC